MKTIRISGQELKISASDERALRLVKYQDYVARKSDFVEGSGRHKRFILPTLRRFYHDGTRAVANYGGWRKTFAASPTHHDGTSPGQALGLREVFQLHAETKRERDFFAKHPRCHSGIFGDPRRINAILKKLDAC